MFHIALTFLIFISIGTSHSLSLCVRYTRDWTVKKAKISMIVCDKFDEDFACIVRFRSQIDLLTDEISRSFCSTSTLGREIDFSLSLSLSLVHTPYHPSRKLIEQIKMIFNVVSKLICTIYFI